MIDDIETGKINMVIVKNLSRFGREYAQMGMYIEHYFEEKGVRFISVAENIDSKNGIDNLVLPFTNVINSFYARQASSKTKAAKEARAKSGMFLGSHAPFGYVKDPNDRHHLIVDPPAAEVVKEIFKLFADGVGYVRMTKILRERGVLNPQAYFNQNNPDYEDLFNLNVTAYTMSQAEVEGKFKTLTNGSKAAATITQMAKTFVALCGYADWSAATFSPQPETSVAQPKQEEPTSLLVASSQECRPTRFDLNYDIHIHLPATRDQAVYDALFASLAKHIPLK